MVQSVVLWSSKWVVQGDEKGQKCRRRAPTGGVGNENVEELRNEFPSDKKGQKFCREGAVEMRGKWMTSEM